MNDTNWIDRREYPFASHYISHVTQEDARCGGAGRTNKGHESLGTRRKWHERQAPVKLARILLWINSACFLVFGAAFLIAPGYMAHLLTGATPSAPNVLIDTRATYGGMALGIGLFFAFCARRPETLRIGLIASLLVAAGIVFGRLTGTVVDGSPNAAMIALLLGDSLFIVLFAVALRRVPGAIG